LAVALNAIAFCLIGKLGPVTFQFFGCAKTICTLVLGTLMLVLPPGPTEPGMWKTVSAEVLLFLGTSLYMMSEMQGVADEQSEQETAALNEYSNK
jgi:uncharacterized membrane protein